MFIKSPIVTANKINRISMKLWWRHVFLIISSFVADLAILCPAHEPVFDLYRIESQLEFCVSLFEIHIWIYIIYTTHFTFHSGAINSEHIFQWVIKDNRSKNKQNVHSSTRFGLKISFNIASNRIAWNWTNKKSRKITVFLFIVYQNYSVLLLSLNWSYLS